MPRNDRLKRLRRRLRPVDALFVTNLKNVRWLTGFTGSAGYALVTGTENILVTDFRYREQCAREVEGWEVVIEKGGPAQALKRLGRKLGIKTLGVEDTVSVGFVESIKKAFKSVRPMRGVVEKLRAVKDKEEIEAIEGAVRVAEEAFRKVRPHIRAGVSENAIALRLGERLRREGSEGLPFDIIVAAGENSALPHARPSSRRLRPGDLVIVDWGARLGGYCSDMTRSFLLKGRGLAEKKAIYSLVLDANRRAVEKARAGEDTASIDRAARDVIKRAGYGECFGHATGHGVGLDVHERPGISWRRSTRVREGMVFTVEPGIYVPGLGGVRIEDLIAVGPRGKRVLTTLSRKMETI
ncbi:MAG: Xaa-Pro peptidase family protein [Nitrospirota bacterium]|jgi:Xaa-Pro aminopeptidase